ASVPKAWMACAIDPQDPFHRQTKFRLPQPTPSASSAQRIVVEHADQTRLSSSRSLNPGLILFAGLSQAQSGTPTVLVDEFDAGPFKSSSYDIKGSATRATRPCLQLMHSYDSNSGFSCQVLLAPTEKSSGCPGLLRCNHAGRSCRKRVIPSLGIGGLG